MGRLDGRVWLVSGAVPGDEVEARIVRDHGRWVDASVARVLSPSPSRREASCEVQASCGGCPMMTVPEELQRAAKRGIVVDALQRIGHLRDTLVEAVVPSPRDLGFRNKIELSLGRGADAKPVLGYHRGDEPGRIVDIAACPVADPRLMPVLDLVRDSLTELGAIFLASGGAPAPRLALRVAETSGATSIVILVEGELPEAVRALAKSWGRDRRLSGGVLGIAGRPGRRGGAMSEVLSGAPDLTETILDTEFRIPASVFTQINGGAARALHQHVLAEAGRPSTVLELYAGAGALGLAFARAGSAVTLVEADPDAVACGLEAALAAGLTSTRSARGDVGDWLSSNRAVGAFDLVIADPPRTGLGRGVVEHVASLRAPRIVIVSCDPATLARDLARFRSEGYRLERVVPFDFFPQTAHVEAVAWLSTAPAG